MTVYGLLVLFFISKFCTGYDGHIRKGLIGDTIYTNFSISKSDVYYEIDLFPGQYIYFKTRSSPSLTIFPDGHEDYFVTPHDMSDFSKISKRPTKKLSSVGNLVAERSTTDFKISYNEIIKAKDPHKIYFDLGTTGPDKITALVQINIMPELEYFIDKEETLSLNDDYFSNFKNGTYVKEVRYGTKLKIFCDQPVDFLDIKYSQLTNDNIKITYEVINKESKITSKEGNGIFVDLTKDKIFVETDDLTCQKNNLKVKLLGFEYNRHDGYNYGFKSFVQKHDDHLEYFYTDTTKSLVVNLPDLYPADCLNEFLDGLYQRVKTKDYIGGSKVINFTRKLKMLDSSMVYSYNKKLLGCQFINYYYSPDMLYVVWPVCDLNNPDSLDKNGFSCTVFVSIDIKSIEIRKDKDLKIRKESGYSYFYLDDPETMSLESKFKPDLDPRTKCGKIDEKNNIIMISEIDECDFNHSVSFILLEDSAKNLKKIIRIYQFDTYSVLKSRSLGKSKFLKMDKQEQYNSVIVNELGKKIQINCKDIDNKGGKRKLYPKGKNTVYRTVNYKGDKGKAWEEVQFEDLVATKGISISKRPETSNDLEIRWQEGYEVKSDHPRPIYFVCSESSDPKDWSDFSKTTIIGVDPHYNIRKYKGCGVNTKIFDHSDTCEFDLDVDENVAFHCPDYVPEFFLGDGQEKYEADPSEKTIVNPFQTLVRCYDRSTFFERLIKPHNPVDVLEDRTSASELRSLWRFDKKKMDKQKIYRAFCVCYSKDGQPISRITVNYIPRS